MLLAGDIGGTKTELAVFSSITTPVAYATFPSAKYANLEDIVRAFLAQYKVSVDRACFGVAGPIVDGQATITNLPWIVNAARLKDDFKLQSVLLMNDLEALATAVPFLQTADFQTLNVGHPATHGPLAVIAPGTGLGEAFLIWDGQHYLAHTSEGGHTDFGPTNDAQIGLLRYLQPLLEHVSYEWVCSGRGLSNVYAYFKESGYAEEPVWLAKQLAQAEDHTPVIIAAALQKISPNPLCVATLDTFVSILGAEAGNLGLKVLSTGGIYLGGGISRRILPFLQKDLFLQAFLRKGRLADILTHIPIHIILNPKAGLLGAAYRSFAPQQ